MKKKMGFNCDDEPVSDPSLLNSVNVTINVHEESSNQSYALDRRKIIKSKIKNDKTIIAKFLVVKNENGTTTEFNDAKNVGIFLLGRRLVDYSVYVRVDRPFVDSNALAIQLERMNTEC